MKTYIIGSSGVIGYNLFQYLKKKNIDVIGTYFNSKKPNLIKYNILKNKITKKFKIKDTDNVIILTACSSPTWVHKNPKVSNKINVIATKKIIDELKYINCKIFFMSSIEVFDGKKGNYHEYSKPSPLNLYGKQKLEIENYLKKNVENFCIIRTSFIVGDNAKQRCPVKLTYDSLLKKNAKMAKDNSFAITSVHDLCKAIFIILKNKMLKKIKIFHISSKQKISRIQLANSIISLSKRKFEMKYKETLFKYIKYSEPRGRLNNLISKNLILNKFKFQVVRDIIKNKLKIIENQK